MIKIRPGSSLRWNKAADFIFGHPLNINVCARYDRSIHPKLYPFFKIN